MVRNYIKKKGEPAYNEEDMQAAILAVREQRMTLREAASNYGMSHTALYYRLKKVKMNNDGTVVSSVKHDFHSKYSSQQVFTKDQESALVEYAIHSSKICYGLTYKQIKVLAYDYARQLKLKMPDSWNTIKSAGDDWLFSFMKRHKELTIRKPENTSLSRLTSFNKTNVDEFFDNYERALQSKSFTAAQIFNLDETGVATVIQAPNVVARRGVKQVGQAVSAERGQSITLCMVINASGNALPPVFIYPRARVNDTMVENGPPGSLVLANSPGSHWMTQTLFLDVLKHIVRQTMCSLNNPILLLMDNHESHCSLEAVQYARENGITFVTFPPHCSHKLQPLDVGVLGPFKAKTKIAQNDWLISNPGKTISIHTLPSLVNIAFNASFTRSNIISSFSKTGLWPLNRLAFSDEDFMSAYVTDRTIPADNVSNTSLPSIGSIIPGCSKDSDAILSKTNADNKSIVMLSPQDIRPYPKAGPRSGSAKGRKKGKSRILTETPEKARLEEERIKRQEKKRKPAKHEQEKIKKVKKNVYKTFCDDIESDTQSDTPSESMSLHDESSDDLETFSDLDSQEFDTRSLTINDFILVSFATKKSRVLFVGQIEAILKEGFRVKFMRKRDETWKFYFPEKEDISEIDSEDIRLKLPTPSITGGTERSASVLSFPVDLSTVRNKIM